MKHLIRLVRSCQHETHIFKTKKELNKFINNFKLEIRGMDDWIDLVIFDIKGDIREYTSERDFNIKDTK